VGYFKGILHGAILGAAAGMLLAPDAGQVTRSRLQQLMGEASRGKSTPPLPHPATSSSTQTTPSPVGTTGAA